MTVPESPHADLLARHRRVLPDWLTLFYDQPIELVSGSGRQVTDGEGRTYLDFFGGILTTMTGHAVPEVVDAIRTQAGRLLHSSTLYLVRPMIELAERISALSGIPDAKVFFVNSGSEANDTALQLCCTVRGGPIRSWRCATATTAGRLPAWPSPGCPAGRRPA